jgi:hypothetical protein
MKALFSIYVLFFVLLPTFSFAVRDKETVVYQKEFLCWEKLVHQSHFAPKGAQRKYSFSLVSVDPEKLISVEEPLGDGTVSRVGFFFANGAFSYAIKQSKDSKDYTFQLNTSGKERNLTFKRNMSKDFKGSSAYFYENPNQPDGIKLPNVVDGATREKLLEAIGERIQNVKSTFDARIKMYSTQQKERFGGGSGSGLQEQSLLSLSEPKRERMKEPDPLDYKKTLETCREAFGSDDKFKTLKGLIESELKKFPAPESDGSGPNATPANTAS